ncbi:MAG: HAD-IIA family hydrolase [Candidatus Hydrogenedentes bacterium]|nr:HAD-IIA family hydrolase [Candidatus Hydrogenedentota bacterium]
MTINRINAFLLDMDGTVYLGPNLIDGAVEFISYLQQSEIPFLFLTNNPSADSDYYQNKQKRMGINVEVSSILTAGAATARYLQKETLYRRLCVLGTPSFEQELLRVGMDLEHEDPEAVVIAFDKTLTYEKLERACLLVSAGLPYIATNPDRVCPTEYGYIPDCGAIAALIESATGRLPKFIGKPEPAFAQLALQVLGREAGETAMVGDRLYTDIAMAHEADMPGILVLSGESTKEDVEKATRKPDLVYYSVKELQKALMAR